MESIEHQEAAGEKTFVYRVLRYTPNLVRDEWINIGVLLYDPGTSERRLRLIEEPDEFRRVRRLHPEADEDLLRALRDDLESRFVEFASVGVEAGAGVPQIQGWQRLLAKWDETLSNALQLAPQKGVIGDDLDVELERLYADHVAINLPSSPVARKSRPALRGYCGAVLRRAQIWERLEKSVRVSPYTFPGDPMRIDYSYRRNGTQGFLQTLSITRAPTDAKLLAYTVERISAKSSLATEFTAVTDVPLNPQTNERHRFVSNTLQAAGISAVSLEEFPAWARNLVALLQAH